VPIAAGPSDGSLPVLERAGLCVLVPGGDGPHVRPIAASEAVRIIMHRLDPGFDVFRRTVAARLRALAADGAWQVQTGDRPEQALPALLDLIGARAP
jgi:hypothetical protein